MHTFTSQGGAENMLTHFEFFMHHKLKDISLLRGSTSLLHSDLSHFHGLYVNAGALLTSPHSVLT